MGLLTHPPPLNLLFAKRKKDSVIRSPISDVHSLCMANQINANIYFGIWIHIQNQLDINFSVFSPPRDKLNCSLGLPTVSVLIVRQDLKIHHNYGLVEHLKLTNIHMIGVSLPLKHLYAWWELYFRFFTHTLGNFSPHCDPISFSFIRWIQNVGIVK